MGRDVDELSVERVADLTDARSDWNRLAELTGSVFATWEWADSWQRHLGGDAELAIGIARRPDGKAAAIFPVSVTRRRPVRLLRFLGAGVSDELGPMCAPQDRAVVASTLQRHVRDVLGGSGVFLCERLWDDDPLVARLGGSVIHRIASPVLPVGGRTFEEYLLSRSRNFREQVRRRERRLMREHKLAYRLTQDPDRLESDMDTLMRLHAARWSRGESISFRGARASFHLEFARRALDNGWLRLWTMELSGQPVAMWYGLRYGGVEWYYQAGRAPAFDELNVGFVLLCHSVRSAFEDGVREYRLGSGDEPYKGRFTECHPSLETVAITTGAGGRLALAAISRGRRA